MRCKNCNSEMHLEEYDDCYMSEYYYYCCLNDNCKCDGVGITCFMGGDRNIEWV